MKKIKVKIGRKEYDTYIDERGVQRFIPNKVVEYLIDNGNIDMNGLRIQFLNGKFSKLDYLEFHLMVGYSVNGFCELSPFFGYQIKNPLWENINE